MPRIGVFGSAFDPPTRGHLDVLNQAAPGFDTILLVPSVAHAFAKRSRPIAVREQLLAAFCADLADLPCAVEVCLLEKQLYQQNPEHPVYTWTLLDALSRLRPGDEITFIRGPDNAAADVWQRFYRYQEIERRWPIFTAKQQHVARSTLVRELLASPNDHKQQLSELVTPSVLKVILDQNLYRNQI